MAEPDPKRRLLTEADKTLLFVALLAAGLAGATMLFQVNLVSVETSSIADTSSEPSMPLPAGPRKQIR